MDDMPDMQRGPGQWGGYPDEMRRGDRRGSRSRSPLPLKRRRVEELTVRRRMGMVARTVAVKKSEIILGGDFGPARKMWWISSSLPYRRGLSGAGIGLEESCWSFRLKT